MEKAEITGSVVIEKETITVNSITISGPNLTKKKLDNMHFVYKTYSRTVKKPYLKGVTRHYAGIMMRIVMRHGQFET